jgi:hypothetical protein
MGLEASLASNIGEWRYVEYAKGLANIARDLDLYCILVTDGETLDLVAEYQTLEIPGEPPLCEKIQALCRAQWHPELDYTEDEYERYVHDFSNAPDYPAENLTREAFDDLIARGKAAFVPIDEFIDTVRCIMECLEKRNSSESSTKHLPDYMPDTMAQLMTALLDLRQAGATKACLMIS